MKPYAFQNHPIRSCIYVIDVASDLQPDSIIKLLRKMEPQKLPYNGGYASSAVWLHVRLFKPVANCNTWVLHLQNHLLDTVDIYHIIKDSIALYARGGRMQKQQWPALSGFKPACVIPRFDNGPIDLLIKIKTRDVLAVSLCLTEFGRYQEQNNISNIFYGIYFGAVILTMILNLALYFTAHYHTSFWYSFYVGTFGLFQAFTLNLINLTRIEDTWLLQVLMPLSAGLCLFSGSLFVKHFLELDKRCLSSRALVYSSVLGLSISVLAPFDAGRTASIWTSIIAPLFVIMIAVIASIYIKKIPRPALFLSTGTSLLALSILLNTLKNFGLLPVNLFTEHGTIIGSAVEFTILAIALVDRITVLQKQTISADKKLEQIERMAVESRLKLLQTQINPHFLFNTLNTIAELTSTDPEKAENVILQLSKFFRYTLTASQTPLIQLEEEIAIVRAYLDIQKERFGARLSYEIIVENELTDVLAVGMTLQTIVENAIKYGISSCNKGGSISIICAIIEDNVRIQVSDTGPGFEKNSSINSTGHGLNSVRERLVLSFGKSAHLSCFNNQGAVVIMTFPRRTSFETSGYNCR